MAHADRPWVLVCGGFHHAGGMDRLNAALAWHLAARGTQVHLVGHDVDPAFERDPLIAVTRVPRPGGLYLAGEVALARAAHRVRAAMTSAGAPPVLLGNGGNCPDADVNWVHSVHHAWPCADDGAPLWFRAKNRAFKAWSRRREAAALRSVGAVVANSQRTRQDLVTHIGLDARHIDIVYPGTDPSWRVPGAAARSSARATWCRDPHVPLVVLVGTVGHDANKGVDTLLTAWHRVAATRGWDAELVIAGPGNTSRWRASATGLRAVRFAGQIPDAGILLDAADLLVSPVRYEAYGLAVHEAICRGVPALVSRTAGVVERFTPGLQALLLETPDDADALAARLLDWHVNQAAWRALVEPLGATLRADTLDAMCTAIAHIGDAATPKAASVA